MTTEEQHLKDDLNDRGSRPQLEEAKRRLQAINGHAIGFIKEHPAACLLGATALGFLLARLARRQRT